MSRFATGVAVSCGEYVNLATRDTPPVPRVLGDAKVCELAAAHIEVRTVEVRDPGHRSSAVQVKVEMQADTYTQAADALNERMGRGDQRLTFQSNRI